VQTYRFSAKDGLTALEASIDKQVPELVERLLSARGNLYVSSGRGFDPILQLTVRGDRAVIDILLANAKDHCPPDNLLHADS
jgi:hypothetical protein